MNNKISPDIIVALGVLILATTLMVQFDFFDWFYGWSRTHESLELDEYLSALIAVLLAASIVAIGRSYKLRKTLTQLQTTQDLLQKIEREKSRQERVVTLNQLSGGLAHEINNALQPVMGLSDVIKAQTPDEKSLVYDCARMIHENAMHMRSIVQKVMQFSRGDVAGIEPYQTLDVILSALSFTIQLMPSTLQFRINFIDGAREKLDTTQVRINRTNLIQVFTNIIANARYAMRDEGVITIDIKEISNADGVPIENLANGTYVCISIKDTGAGMDEKTLKLAFEPFFTTKPEGQGTGLGLSTAYGIIHQWNGAIMLESVKDVGTKASIYIPVQEVDLA